MSELRENVTAEQFRIAYESFVEQADKNAISRKANLKWCKIRFE